MISQPGGIEMEQKIKELTLLLLYVTSWEDMELKSLNESKGFNEKISNGRLSDRASKY